MAFYEVSFVGKVDADGKPYLLPEGGRPSVRIVNVWDDRPEQRLADDYRTEGHLRLHLLGHQHSKGRPLEWRGTITVFAPHLISIERDIKAEQRQPGGPVEFVPRTPRNAKPEQDS